MNLRDLFLRIRALVAPRRVERELDEELAFHIERETRKQIAAGVSPSDARTRARLRFGSVPLAADECRDARGTRFVDNLARDILYAFRTFRRAPLAAVTIVATVALGLGLVTAVFSFYDAVFLHVDGVRSPKELLAVQVERQTGPGADEEMRFTQPDYDALRRDTSVFAEAFGISEMFTRVDGRATRAALVTGNFFQVLGARAALGRPLMPDDDERSGGVPVIVLSHVGWRKLFQHDRAVVGRRTAINGAPYEVVGVMPEGFRGIEDFAPDYWAPLSQAGRLLGEHAGWEDEVAVEVVGRLKPGISPRAATDALQTWAAGRSVWTGPGRPTRVSVAPPEGLLEINAVNGLIIFSPLFFVFGLILMIGCTNVANLLLARGVSRQREIGIRLSLGASRRRIIRQLLTESLILALAAAACGLVVAQLFLDVALYTAITALPPEIAQFVSLINIPAPSLDWRVLVFLVAGAIASTIFFGLAPALQATRLELVRTMRGEVTRNARPGRARQTLIAVQVGASALLVICAAVLLRGVFAAATREPGIRTSDTLRVSIENESRRVALLQALAADPVVTAVAASSFSMRGVIETSAPGGAAAGSVPETPSRMGVGLLHVSSEYFDVLGLEVVSGRGFSQAERTAETGVVVVSEGIARQLWPNGEAVGQVVRLEASQLVSPVAPPIASGEARSVDATVVGVVRDPGRRSGSTFEAFQGVYPSAGLESPGPWLLLRVRGNPDQARLALLERLASINPAVNNIITLRTLTDQSYFLQMGFWLTVVAGGLALVLTVSGLYSVLSYVVEQQAKDIGVRIALGAATKHVVGLVLSQSLGPVGIGLAAGGALAAALAIVLSAVDSGIGSVVDVLDPGAYAASLVVIVTSCVVAVSVPALRAARIDPIATLRKD